MYYIAESKDEMSYEYYLQVILYIFACAEKFPDISNHELVYHYEGLTII